MLSGTENRKSGAGRSGATTRFCGFHACARSLTAGASGPGLNLQQSRLKAVPCRVRDSHRMAETSGSGRRSRLWPDGLKPGTPECLICLGGFLQRRRLRRLFRQYLLEGVGIEFKLSGYACIHLETAEIVDFADDVALTAKPGGEVGIDRHKDRLRSLRCDFEVPRRSSNLIVHPR
jgi:hypothetical protein